MKRFKFRFEAVHKHREIIENARLQEFGRLQGELAACEVRIVNLRAECNRTMTTRPLCIDVEDSPRRERYIDTLRVQIADEERLKEGLGARVEDARLALITARQAREALDRIRQADEKAYMQHAALAEQNMLDEISTQRYQRAQSR
jgi:flagellar export protein FliJ